MARLLGARLAAPALLACLLGASVARPQNPPAPALVIRDVTVISPERAAPLEHAYVRIRNGRIEEVSAKPLDEKQQIDGRGRFLIPGLIDSHVHLGAVPGMSPAQRAAHRDLAALADAQEARSYLYFGFTTVLSLGGTAEPIKRWNALDIRPDAYFCGGTPVLRGYSFASAAEDPYFLFNPDQAGALPPSVDPSQHTPAAVVNRMARDGAMCVKSYYEPGFGAMAGKLPVPSLQMIQAVVAAARARSMPVFLHANSRPAQEFAARAGVDVVAHGMWNGHDSTKGKLAGGVEPILQAFLEAGTGYQPTSQVIRGLGAELDDDFFADPLLVHVYSAKLIRLVPLAGRRLVSQGRTEGRSAPCARRGRRVRRRRGEPPGAKQRTSAVRHRHAQRADYTNPPGLNGLYEMRAWIAAGVSARQLFRAATIENARIMRLDRDIGTVERGKRAHLLLLRANPLDGVEAYNSIETVILAGRPIPRESLSVQGR